MEENYSDTEHISTLLLNFKIHFTVAGKKNEKFTNRVASLRTLLLILLTFGSGLGKSIKIFPLHHPSTSFYIAVFCFFTWNNSSNELL